MRTSFVLALAGIALLAACAASPGSDDRTAGIERTLDEVRRMNGITYDLARDATRGCETPSEFCLRTQKVLHGLPESVPETQVERAWRSFGPVSQAKGEALFPAFARLHSIPEDTIWLDPHRAVADKKSRGCPS